MGAAPPHKLLTLLKLRVMYTNTSHYDSSINNSDGGLAINYTHGGPSIQNAHGSSTINNKTDQPPVEQDDDGDEWEWALPKSVFLESQMKSRNSARIITKATITVVSFQFHGAMTRAEKMRKEKSGPARSLPKRSKEDQRPSNRAAKCECRTNPNGQS